MLQQLYHLGAFWCNTLYFWLKMGENSGVCRCSGKEKALQILDTFSEEQLAAFVVLFGGILNSTEPPTRSEQSESNEP